MARGEIVARNYAGALFELALKEASVKEVAEALRVIAGLLDETPALRTFLDTPRIEAVEKKRVLREALSGKVPGSLLDFLQLVIDKRRQSLIPEMDEEYRKLLDEHLGRTHVEVSVARELDEGTLAEVSRRLSEVLGKEVIPHVRVRPELLGGVAFRAGDLIFDGSVRRRLERMRRQLLSADVSTDQQVA